MVPGSGRWYLIHCKICLVKIISPKYVLHFSWHYEFVWLCVKYDPVLCALGPSLSSCGTMALAGFIVQVPWTGPPSSIRWRAFCVHESQPVLHHCIIWSNKRYYFSLQALLLTCNHLIVQKFLTPKWHFYILSITRIVCEQKMSII